MSSIAGIAGVAIVAASGRSGVCGGDGCGGARELEFEDGKREESALCGGEEEGERGDLGDGGGRSFPFAGYGGTGDGVYTGGGTNDAFIRPESAEPSRPTSIAACRSLE
jgi:hypothetical protein